MNIEQMLERKLVLPVWRLWLMNQAFRFIPGNKRGFGPGLGPLIRYETLRLKHWVYELDRLRWRALSLRAYFSKSQL